MVGVKKHLVILFIYSFLFSNDNNIDLRYQNGIDAYRKGLYDLAEQEFEFILELNWDSPELYYNLGNTYYRKGNIAGAIWAYESCLKILPIHSDAQYNLKLANLKVKDKVSLPAPPIYLKWYFSIKERFTPSEWIMNSLLIFCLFSLFFTLSRYIFNPIILFFRSLLLILFLLMSFISINSIWTNKTIKEGIVYDVLVEVRSEPNSFSTRLFEVHSGLKVVISKVLDNWIKIELLDGKTGWISNNQIRLIR